MISEFFLQLLLQCIKIKGFLFIFIHCYDCIFFVIHYERSISINLHTSKYDMLFLNYMYQIPLTPEPHINPIPVYLGGNTVNSTILRDDLCGG